MPEEIKVGVDIDWKTILSIGFAVAAMFIGLGGCVYLVNVSEHKANAPYVGSTNSEVIPEFPYPSTNQ